MPSYALYFASISSAFSYVGYKVEVTPRGKELLPGLSLVNTVQVGRA
jgi:hypothetical protein